MPDQFALTKEKDMRNARGTKSFTKRWCEAYL